MKALRITRFGDPDVLAVVDVPDPPPPVADQIVVRVRAASLNRPDLMQRVGKYPPPRGVPEDMPGLDFAGDVSAVGPLANTFQPGDRVFGLVSGAAQAEFVTTTESLTMPMPATLSYEEAAAIPEAYITAHDALFARARALPAERVLVHAVGSGVGTAALQLARAVGCVVIGTARTPSKLEQAKRLGLDVGIEPRDGLFADEVLRATSGAGADVILDLVGAEYMSENLRSLAMQGRLVFVAVPTGSQAQIDIGLVMRKRATMVGTVLRPRPPHEKALAVAAFAKMALPLFERGALKPHIDEVFPLERAADAHRHMESNESFGKIVLRV